MIWSEELVKREDRRNFFPIGGIAKSSRDDDNKVKDGVVSTDIKGNLGVTVIVPGGEQGLGICILEILLIHRYMRNCMFCIFRYFRYRRYRSPSLQ